jgi:hypothetical protein
VGITTLHRKRINLLQKSLDDGLHNLSSAPNVNCDDDDDDYYYYYFFFLL